MKPRSMKIRFMILNNRIGGKGNYLYIEKGCPSDSLFLISLVEDQLSHVGGLVSFNIQEIDPIGGMAQIDGPGQ